MAVVTSERVHADESAVVTPDAPWTYWDTAKAIGVVIVGSIVAGIVAYLIADTIVETGHDFEDNAAAWTVMLFASFVVQELLLLWAALRFGPWKHRLNMASLGLRAPERGSWWFAGALAAAALAIAYGYDALLGLLDAGVTAATPEETFESPAPFIVIIVGALIMAPIAEEIFFRGFIFGGIRARRGWIAAAIVSSLLFGAAHLSGWYLPSYTLIGLLFAWSYQHTGSLRPGIIAHALTNTVSIGALALAAWIG
jgi:membrane protease YdiL (CAAX protease family)